MRKSKWDKLIEELQEKDKQHRELMDRLTKVRGVIRAGNDGNEFMQIIDVDYTLEGIMVYVQ